MTQIYKNKSLYFYKVFQAFRNIRIGVFIAFVNLLIQGISFFVQNFIARNLGTSDYGFFGILQTDYSIFCAIADFGMSTLILAFFGMRATQGRLFRSILQLRLLCTGLTACLMVAFACLFRKDHPIFAGELILTFGLLFQHAFFDWYFICGKYWKKLFYSKLLHTLSYSAVMGFTLLYFKAERIELIALAMVLAALPAFFFGVTQALSTSIFKVTHRTMQFCKLMLKAGVPYAIASFAAFAYLPVGLYVADSFASAEFLSAYNFGHKILLLCSGIMVHFISSNLITLHMSKDSDVHVKDVAVFTAFIALCSSPLWLFPQQFLKIFFFAVPWTDPSLLCSANILRILSFSLLFQAARMTLISALLKSKRIWTYAIIVSAAGLTNIIACTCAGLMLENRFIPLFALTGDVVITLVLWIYFVRTKQARW